MIKIITETDPRPQTVSSVSFKYFNAETERWHNRVLTLKGLLQARKSGNNCYWAFYLGGWHNDFVFCYDIRKPDEITIVVSGANTRFTKLQPEFEEKLITEGSLQ